MIHSSKKRANTMLVSSVITGKDYLVQYKTSADLNNKKIYNYQVQQMIKSLINQILLKTQSIVSKHNIVYTHSINLLISTKSTLNRYLDYQASCPNQVLHLQQQPSLCYPKKQFSKNIKPMMQQNKYIQHISSNQNQLIRKKSTWPKKDDKILKKFESNTLERIKQQYRTYFTQIQHPQIEPMRQSIIALESIKKVKKGKYRLMSISPGLSQQKVIDKIQDYAFDQNGGSIKLNKINNDLDSTVEILAIVSPNNQIENYIKHSNQKIIRKYRNDDQPNSNINNTIHLDSNITQSISKLINLKSGVSLITKKFSNSSYRDKTPIKFPKI